MVHITPAPRHNTLSGMITARIYRLEDDGIYLLWDKTRPVQPQRKSPTLGFHRPETCPASMFLTGPPIGSIGPGLRLGAIHVFAILAVVALLLPLPIKAERELRLSNGPGDREVLV